MCTWIRVYHISSCDLGLPGEDKVQNSSLCHSLHRCEVLSFLMQFLYYAGTCDIANFVVISCYPPKYGSCASTIRKRH
jgi:hypothetical protein